MAYVSFIDPWFYSANNPSFHSSNHNSAMKAVCTHGLNVLKLHSFRSMLAPINTKQWQTRLTQSQIRQLRVHQVHNLQQISRVSSQLHQRALRLLAVANRISWTLCLATCRQTWAVKVLTLHRKVAVMPATSQLLGRYISCFWTEHMITFVECDKCPVERLYWNIWDVLEEEALTVCEVGLPCVLV